MGEPLDYFAPDTRPQRRARVHGPCVLNLAAALVIAICAAAFTVREVSVFVVILWVWPCLLIATLLVLTSSVWTVVRLARRSAPPDLLACALATAIIAVAGGAGVVYFVGRHSGGAPGGF